MIGLSGRWRTTEIEVLLASVENRVGLGIPLLSSHQTVQGGVDRQVELSADSVAQTLARHDYFRKCRTNTDTRQEQDSFFFSDGSPICVSMSRSRDWRWKGKRVMTNGSRAYAGRSGGRPASPEPGRRGLNHTSCQWKSPVIRRLTWQGSR